MLVIDGKVDAAELADTHVRYDEVVLSACSTGWRPQAAQGIELSGDDVLGLPGALLEAGARAVVVSIPKAADEATRDVHARLPRSPRRGPAAARRVPGDTGAAARRRRARALYMVRPGLLLLPLMADSPDIVVLVPGITGSVLERNGKEVWGPTAGAVFHGLFSAGRSLQDLKLGDDPPDVDDLGDGVVATRVVGDVHLFPGLWKIDGYTKVAKRIQRSLRLEPGTSYFELPYDWRRDNRVAARRLKREAEGWLARRRQTHPDAKIVFVAHSMGGLICRYYIEVLGGFEHTRALITFGTPVPWLAGRARHARATASASCGCST